MAKRSKAERKRHQRAKRDLRAALRPSASVVARRLPERRGRPRTEREVGPTPETQAKLEPDLLDLLTRRKTIDKDQAAAGREILDAWDVVIPAHLRGTYGLGSTSAPDSPRAEWLTQTWNRWANGCFARCHVRCFVIVEWLLPATSEMQRRYDAGAQSILKAALDWWRLAASGRGDQRSPAQQVAVRNRADTQLLDNRTGLAAL